MSEDPDDLTRFDTTFTVRSLATTILETHYPLPFDPVTKREVHPAYQPRCSGCVQSQWPCALVRLAEAVLATTLDDEGE